MTSELKKIFQQLKMKEYSPVYLIDGEEPYYLDLILDYFENKILQPHEKDFNLITLFAKDVEWKDVINACRRFPMFAEKQVVILRDASQLRLGSLNDYIPYVEHPTPSTILLIEHRFKKVDGRNSIIKSIKKAGVYFTSEKLKDEKDVTSWIQNYGNEINFIIPEQEAELLGTYLGNDLQKISNEIEKIRINVPEVKQLTKELISKYVGISRDFNALDFPEAIISDNREKVFQMVSYFISNPKSAPMPLLIGTLYGQFNRLYQLNYLRGKTDKEIGDAIGMSPFIVKKISTSLNKWPLKRVEKCLLLLSRYSAMSVGVDNFESRDTEILKEMVAQMLEMD